MPSYSDQISTAARIRNDLANDGVGHDDADRHPPKVRAMRIASVRAFALVMATLALAISSGAAPAHADLVATPMPPKTIDKVSRDGWEIEMRLERETVTRTPNLAGAPNSHEAFLTVTGVASASGGSSPISDSVLVIGYQLGCQQDVSAGLQFGGTGGAIPNGDVTITPGAAAGNALTLGSAGGGPGSAKLWSSRA